MNSHKSYWMTMANSFNKFIMLYIIKSCIGMWLWALCCFWQVEVKNLSIWSQRPPFGQNWRSCKHWMQYSQVIWHKNKNISSRTSAVTPVILTQNHTTLINPAQRTYVGQKLTLKIWKTVIALELHKLQMFFYKFCYPNHFILYAWKSFKIINEASFL